MLKRVLLTATFFSLFLLIFGISSALAKTPAPGSITKDSLKNEKLMPELKKTLLGQYEDVAEGKVSKEAYFTGEKGALSLLQTDIYFKIMGGEIGVDETGKIRKKVGFAQQTTTYIAALLGNPPASTQAYLADIFQSANLGFVQPAYAQGLGFAALNPILEIWKIFRNIAFFFFVLIFIVIGFLIMFRQKISGQTIVTAQQAIPQIIIALITVTFSYAIAGIMIDIMYLVMGLMINLFRGQNVTDDLLTQNIFQIGTNFLVAGSTSAAVAVDEFIRSATNSNDADLQQALGVVGGLTAAVIFAIAFLIAIFRLFFELLRTYISIIISIAFAPIILMTGAIPGRNAFGGWIKSLVGNLASFPLVLLVFIIFSVMRNNISDQSSGFLAPYLLGQGSGQAITVLLSVGFLLIGSDIVKQGQKLLGGGGGVFEQLGQNVGDSIKRGWTGNAELIPGMAVSNLSKLPMGGISAQNIVRKVGITGAGTVGGVAAGLSTPLTSRAGIGDILPSSGRSFRKITGYLGTRFGDPNYKSKEKAKEKK